MPLTPTPTAASVVIHTPQTGAQPRDKTTTTAMDTITLQPYVKAENPKDLPSTPNIEMIEVLPEVTEVPEEVDYPRTPTDITPAVPLVGIHIITTPVSPAVPPTAPPTVHFPIGLTDLITDTSPCSTPRTVSRSSLQPLLTVLYPHFTPKVLH